MVDHAQVTAQARQVNLAIDRDQDVAGFNTPGEKGQQSGSLPLPNNSMHGTTPDQLPTSRLRLLTYLHAGQRSINRILFIPFASSQIMFLWQGEMQD